MTRSTARPSGSRIGECYLQLQKTIEDFDARALTIKSVKRDEQLGQHFRGELRLQQRRQWEGWPGVSRVSRRAVGASMVAWRIRGPSTGNTPRALRRARELVAESEALRQPLYASPESPTAPSACTGGHAAIVGHHRRQQAQEPVGPEGGDNPYC
jgi:hypothetical protein